ncbi:hypothetical protein RIF29_29693 [Crotalaria pallida]|uniref:Uncharacterized protein n=1 Tax=Crotalaria pallida TaxID=3830 RepID=A0AAN9HWG4_CROPI
METCVNTLPLFAPVGSKTQLLQQTAQTRPNVVGMQPLPYKIGKGELQIGTSPCQSRHVRCRAALNAKCSAGQTQTLSRKSGTSVVTPDKVKSPKLDDNGPGFPPRDNDGNGGNGGGGGNWSGGLLLLGILGMLDILKEIETEWLKKHDRKNSFVNAN